MGTLDVFESGVVVVDELLSVVDDSLGGFSMPLLDCVWMGEGDEDVAEGGLKFRLDIFS